MNLSEERAARNEALFREVNEQVERLSEPPGAAGDPRAGLFVCECGDDSCSEQIAVPRAAYEAVRANPRRFLVVPGHDNDFERIVERTEQYAVVEKEGRAADVAEQTDPRR